jgi:RNA polymerase sigma-70 factor (ECF subfamily)
MASLFIATNLRQSPATCLPGETFPALVDIVYVSVQTPAGFSDLYERYSRDVYRFALYLSGDPILAEDITGETFLRVWSSAAPVRPATVKGYLLAIARNLHLHELRRANRLSELKDQMPSSLSLQRQTESRAQLERVLADLRELPEADRAAVLLRAEDGLSYEEISEVLGLPVATVKVKVHRARLKLAEKRGRSVLTS